MQGERRPVGPTCGRETLLYGLWVAGVVTDADLAPSDEWRCRYGIEVELKTHAVTLPSCTCTIPTFAMWILISSCGVAPIKIPRGVLCG